MSLLAILLAFCGAFYALAFFSSQATHRHAAEARARFDRETQPGGLLATPAGFEAACGQADSAVHLPDGAPALLYDGFRVDFPPGQAVIFQRRHTDDVWLAVDAEEFLKLPVQPCKGVPRMTAAEERPSIRWFGRPHLALVYTQTPATITPVGAECIWCGVRIAPGADGFVDAGGHVSHRHCMLDTLQLPRTGMGLPWDGILSVGKLELGPCAMQPLVPRVTDGGELKRSAFAMPVWWEFWWETGWTDANSLPFDGRD